MHTICYACKIYDQQYWVYLTQKRKNINETKLFNFNFKKFQVLLKLLQYRNYYKALNSVSFNSFN